MRAAYITCGNACGLTDLGERIGTVIILLQLETAAFRDRPRLMRCERVSQLVGEHL